MSFNKERQPKYFLASTTARHLVSGVLGGQAHLSPLGLEQSAAWEPLPETLAASVPAEAGASFPWEVTRVLLANHTTEWLGFRRVQR